MSQIVASIVLVVLAIPLILGLVPRNWFYGVRTPRTLASDEAWYPANHIGGVVLLALGTLPFIAAGAHTSTWWLAVALVVRGTGLGAVTMAVMLGVYDGLNRAEVPHASSMSRIFQQLGGSFGTAILAVVLQRQLAGHPGPTAFDHTFVWALVFTAIAAIPAVRIPTRRPAFEQASAEPEQTEAAIG